MTPETFTYTVADEYGQQSASVEVTISGGTFLNASADSESTPAGTAIDINVLANDQASADLLPLAVAPGSITTPSPSGTAVLQSNGTIRYTPATGVSGIDATFSYTAKPSAIATPTSTAQVTVRVLSVNTGALPKLQPAVPVSKWHCVGFDIAGRKATYDPGRSGFAAAVAAGNLVAGDVIVLDDGTYSGSVINCDKDAAAGNHIMVRARNHGKAIVDHQLSIHGKYWWFTGIKFTYKGTANPNYSSSGQAILADDAGLWVTNCLFTGYAFIHIYPNNAITNIRICYNTINATTLATGTDTGIFITVFDTGTSDRAPVDTEIAWNRVTLNTRASTAGEGHSRNIMILHSSHSTAADQTQFITRSFRFHHNHCVGPWAECIYFKRNICVEFNYIEWTNGLSNFELALRHGMLTNNPQYDIGGIIRGNLLHSGSKTVFIDIGGVGGCITCNRMEGGAGGQVSLGAGNGLGNFGENKPNRDGADNAQIVENIGFGTVNMGLTPAGDDVIRGETAGHRNGWASNVRIYKGDSNWNPAIARNADPNGNLPPVPTILSGYGTGMAAKVTPITVADLASAGCDPM